ncbi:TPA: PerC family transcriptional regulator [Escherichia coli]|nr:PerC family transcriptional regulator [Escherichia coli]
MIHDSKAEALEARGLYRRAAARWAEVIMLANDDKAREQAAKRRAECIRKAARPPARQDNFGEMRDTISRAHAGMGLHQPNGEAFRKYPGSKNCNQ